MGEIKNPENSGVSDPSDETTDPTEESETTSDTETDSDIGEEIPVEPSEEEVGDTTANESVKDEINEITSITPNALQPADFTVTAKEPDTAEGAEPNALKELASAAIVYTNGCVSADGKIRKDADITFKLVPNAGVKLGTVQYTTKGTADGAVDSSPQAVSADGDGVYTIPKSALMHGDAEKVNDVNVTIVVNSAEVEYTLKVVATGYKLYETKTADGKTVVDDTKEINDAAAKKIKYSDTTGIPFAVVANDGTGTKLRSVTAKVGDGDNEAKPLESTTKTDPAEENGPTYPIYTVKASDLAGIAQNDNQDITIEVNATESADIIIDKSGVGEGATVVAVTNADQLYDEDTYADAGSASGAKEGQKVIFAITMDDAYKPLTAADVTATLDDEDITVVSVDAQTKGEGESAKEIPAHYVIDLVDATEAATLYIKVATDLKDTANQVKFESVSDNSIITKASDADTVVTGKTIKVKENTYSFDAKAKPGYKIYAITAAYTKKYTAQENKTTPEDKAITEGLATDILKVDDDGKPAGAASVDGVQVKFTGEETIEGTTWAWTTSTVEVKVNANMDAVTDDKTVTVTSAYEYEVKTGDKVVLGSDNDEYTVKAGAEFFEFTVDAEAEPDVAAKDESNNSILLGEGKKEEAGWSYKIAAAALADNQEITITRKTFNIAVAYDSKTVSAEVYDQNNDLMDDATANEGVDTYSSKQADYDYKFVIEPKDNAKIAGVSYTLGDSETPERVTARGDSYVFYAKLTDNLHVTVETKDEYDLVVKEYDAVVKADSKKVYNVGHASTVTAQLLKGDVAQGLFNAEVKDGNAVAATIAKITGGNLVTLEFDSTEYNKVLTVVLTLSDRTTTEEFKVKTTAAAAEVTLTGVKNGKVELPVDTKASYKLAVKPANTTLAGIGVKVVPADDAKKTDKAAIDEANAAVGAAIVEGNLVITAKPAMTGAESAAKVIIVDQSGLSAEAIAALTVDDALRNGVVTVTTKNATIDAKSPTMSLVSTTDTKVKVKLGVPKGVVDPETGEIYYKVELTVPATPAFPEGTSDAAKAAITAALTKAATDWNRDNLYQKKETLDAKGGLLEIPVMVFADGVDAALKKGVLMNGFSVKASLVQTLAAEGDPSVAGTTITGGDPAELTNIATKNPYYEVKLGLKKGTTTLITGQDKDVVIATPQFNKLTSYSNVTVEFVNTSTGELLGDGASDDVGGDGNNEGYTDGYYGLYAKYDELQNAVIVNAVDASYDNYDAHKNLGVKVTAYAEDSAYGAVATQKITVANGIQAINPSAPWEIYKKDKSAAKLTVTTDLNHMSADKKYAPKNKKLNYEIVGPVIEEDVVSLSQDLRANVTVKNGKVTIGKNYVVKGRDSENMFRVKVTAADYPDSEIVEYTDNILITGQPITMGTIAVFDVTDGETAAKLVALNNGDLTATKQAGEFRVAVLVPGMRTTKKTYDLSEGSTDILSEGLFTFTSGNAKSVAVAPNTVWEDDSREVVAGDLTINKAAKNVKITLTPKDGSKLGNEGVLVLKTVGQESKDPALKISRYKGSVSSASELLHEGGATEIHYNGNSTNNYFKLEVVKPVTVGETTSYVPFYLANYQISFGGARQISKTVGDTGDSYKIVANAKEATITLKNKAVRNAAPIVYKLINDDCVTDKNAKAPKIATTAKLAQNTGIRLVTYTVKGQRTDDFTGNYVVLSADNTKKNPSDIADVLTELDKPLPIILGQTFNLTVETNNHSGNYNLIATVGSLENGVFKPLYKDAKVVVKIAKQGKANLSVTGSYTLPLKSYSGMYLKYKSGNGYITFTNSPDGNDNYAKNAIINGKENSFKEYFAVKMDQYGDIYVVLKELPLTAPAGNPDAPALDKIVSDACKNDRIGYISVNNGEKYIDVKLTITLKDYTKDNTKYKVTATPVLEGPNAVTKLTILEGKNKAGVTWLLAESVGGIFKPVSDGYGNWYLEAANLSPGNHPVTLYMVSRLAADGYLDDIDKASGETAKQDLIRKYGVKTSITVKAAAKTTGSKVVLKNKGSNNWNVADTDYVYTGWSKDVPFTFKTGLSVAANTNVIDVKATVNNKDVDYVSFVADKQWMTTSTVNNKKVVSLPTEYHMAVNLDKKKLDDAIKADAANDEIAARNKLAWGKTIKVKATFSYGTDGPKADEVIFTVKLPSEGAADTAVKTALEAAKSKLQSDIETYYKDLMDRVPYLTSNGYTVSEAKVLVNNAMDSYIQNAVKKEIQGGEVTVEITSDGSNESGSEAYATWWNVSVKSKTTDTPVLYDHKFEIPAQKTVSEIETAVNSLNLSDDVEIKDENENLILKVTADTTATQFAAAVREKLGETASRNISITARIDRTPKKPTTDEEGSISFVLTIKDLSKAPSDVNYSNTMSAIEYTLPQLDDLSACKNKVTAGLDAAALTKIVKDAYVEVKATGAALEAKVGTLVVEEANALIDNNPDITVTGIATDDDGATTLKLTAPTGATNQGKLAFTLQLTEAGKTADELKDANYKLIVSETTLNAIEEFQTPTELLDKAKEITEIDYVATEDAALAAIKAEIVKLSKNPAYATTNIVVEKTANSAQEGESNNGTVFTAPGDDAGSITKVIVKVGTGDGDKATIGSVAIKKQVITTPTE